IDTSAAEAAPGVKAVITGRDIPPNSAKLLMGEGALELHDMGDNALAHDKALYHGHAVAAVAATSIEAARAATALIRVAYEPLEPVLTIEQAIQPGAAILDPNLVTNGKTAEETKGPTNIAGRVELARGDVDAGFAEADVIVEGEFRTPATHQGYIEPHACVAR